MTTFKNLIPGAKIVCFKGDGTSDTVLVTDVVDADMVICVNVKTGKMIPFGKKVELEPWRFMLLAPGELVA